VDPLSDPLLLKNLVAPGIEPRKSNHGDGGLVRPAELINLIKFVQLIESRILNVWRVVWSLNHYSTACHMVSIITSFNTYSFCIGKD
jgi:hypothetical protein